MHIFTRIPGYSKLYNCLKFSFLPKTFNSKPIGVITKKNRTLNMIGETIIPNVIPSFIHKKLGILKIDGHIDEIINKNNEIEKKINLTKKY